MASEIAIMMMAEDDDNIVVQSFVYLDMYY
jgi:hypothetical protein